MKNEIAITTDYTDDGGPIEPKLRLIAKAGFKYIHWCEHWVKDVLYEDFYITGLEKLLKKYDLGLLDTHNAAIDLVCEPAADKENERKKGTRLLANRIYFTGKLGGDCVVVHPPINALEEAVFIKRWKQLGKSIEETRPLCEKMKVKLAIENTHNITPVAIEQLELLFKKNSPAFLGFCFDSGHANIAGTVNMIENYGSRTFALHLHDNHGKTDEHALPGRGNLDWNRVMNALKKNKYPKPVNFELILRDPKVDPEEFLKKAYETGMKLMEKTLLICPEIPLEDRIR